MSDNDNKPSINFTFIGGNNQILPNATEANQYIIGGNSTDAQQMTGLVNNKQADVMRLRSYINNVEVLNEYVQRLVSCKSAKELGLVVADMRLDERVGLDKDTSVKKEFIEVLQPLASQVKTGIDNIRKYISEGYDSRKEQLRQQKLRSDHVSNN